MKSHLEQVRYLAKSVPEINNGSNRRRKVLLTLLYWKVFDGIELPPEVMQQILSQGTNPETITRALRLANREPGNEQNVKEEEPS